MKNHMVWHMKICKAKVRNKMGNSSKASKLVKSKEIFEGGHFGELRVKVIARMAYDDILIVIKSDHGVMLYEHTMFESGVDEAFNEISNRIRNVARLLKLFLEETNNQGANCFNLIEPESWYAVIKPTKKLVKH